MMHRIIPVGIALTPFLLSKSLLDPGQAIQYLYLTLFITVVTFIQLPRVKNEFYKAIGGIFTWKNPFVLLSLLWLLATLFSLREVLQKSEGYVETARVLFFIYSAFSIALWIQLERSNITRIATGFCLLCFVLAVAGCIDLYEAWQVTPNDAYYAMSGRMGNRNLLAIMLSLCLPFHFIVYAHSKSQAAKALVSISFLFAVAVIVPTGSRSGWLSLVVLLVVCGAIVCISYFKGRIPKTVLRKIALGFSIFFVAGCASLSALFFKSPGASQNMQERLQSFFNFRSEKNIHTQSINERLEIWQSSIQLIQEYPLTGVGAGNWKFNYPKYGLPERCQQGEFVFLQPHNDFLCVFSETGIIGGLAFVLLFAFILLTGIRNLFISNEFQIMPLALLTGISMYAVHSFFDFPKERPLILFTFSCYLAMATVSINPPRKDLSKAVVSLLLSIGLIIAVVTSWFWIVRMQNEQSVKKAFEARQTGNFKQMKKYLDQTNAFLFQSDLTGTPIDWHRSEAAYMTGDTKAFKRYAENALKLHPYQLNILHNLGLTCYYEGDTATAIKYWNRAISVAPNFKSARMSLEESRKYPSD